MIQKDKALSRQLDEGGYTFLKRVLKEHFETGSPVIINTGHLYLQYSYDDSHDHFMQGVTILEDDGRSQRTLSAFRDVAESYDVKRGICEIFGEKKKDPFPKRTPSL